MGDTYQAVYDAVRSKISGGNIAEAVREVMRNSCDFHVATQSIQHAAIEIGAEQTRPSVLFRPDLRLDGNAWSAVYGPNIQEGVCGYGDSPEAAMRDFDKHWNEKLSAATT